MHAITTVKVSSYMLQLCKKVYQSNFCTETRRQDSRTGARNRAPTGNTWVRVAYRVWVTYKPLTISRETEDADEIVRKHIKSLHRYNEAKDATQVRRIYSTILPELTHPYKILMGRVRRQDINDLELVFIFW